MTLEDLRRDIAGECAKLGGDELEVLRHIARRLVVGGRQYGALSLDTDDRDWNREAEEELVDAMVYRACRSIVAERQRQAEPHRAYAEAMRMDLRVKEALVSSD